MLERWREKSGSACSQHPERTSPAHPHPHPPAPPLRLAAGPLDRSHLPAPGTRHSALPLLAELFTDRELRTVPAVSSSQGDYPSGLGAEPQAFEVSQSPVPSKAASSRLAPGPSQVSWRIRVYLQGDFLWSRSARQCVWGTRRVRRYQARTVSLAMGDFHIPQPHTALFPWGDLGAGKTPALGILTDL